MERQPRDPRIAHLIVENAIAIPGIEWDGEIDPLPLDHDAWFVWMGRRLAERAILWEACARSKDARDAARALCMQPDGLGMLYWLISFGFIHEPRNEDARHPFIPEPAQAELVLVLFAVMATPKSAKSSLAIEKAREVGATWLSCAHDAWSWQFLRTYYCLIASRTEEAVDKAGEPSTYFWKVDFLLKNQPEWLLPRGYTHTKPHRVSLHIINPVTSSTIRGTATIDDVGRGGRYRTVKFDEANFNEYFEAGWNTAASATDHRFAISSASMKKHKAFYNMVRGLGQYKGAQPTVFSFHWWMRVGRDQAWLAIQREVMSDDFFRAEVLMDYRAGGGSFVYPMFDRHDLHAIQPNPMFPKYIGIDDGYTDAFAMVGLQVDPVTAGVDILWAYQNYGKTIDFYGHFLRGEMNARFDWTEQDRQLILYLQRHRLTEATLYGDKHGDDTSLVTGTSPFEELTIKFGIYVITNLDPTRNSHRWRNAKVGEMASRMRFNDAWGAPSVLSAVRESRFPERKEGSQQTNEARKPIHDSGSHLRTALEHWAGNYAFHMFEPQTEGAMMLPPNPLDRLAEQYATSYKRQRSEQASYEESIPGWMRE